MVKIDGNMAMVVLPATEMVSLGRLKEMTGANDVQLASEPEFKDLFPNCALGAMPPFGNLWGMDVYADDRLSEDKEIAFNAGSHTELVRLAYADFERLVKPRVLSVAR
jgi:Ala-tRNA(Pro) deacylase